MFLDLLLGGRGPRAATPENPRFSLTDPDAVDAFFGGDPASTGVRVTRELALTHAPWWRGVRLLSDDTAKLPLRMCKIEGETRKPDPDHPADWLLRRKFNDLMTAYQGKRLLTSHAVTCGNGYAYIDRDGAARPKALLPLDPSSVTPARVNGKLWYVYQVSPENKRKLRGEDVLHIKGFGFDGIVGYGVWEKARETLGLGMGSKKFGAVFFKNNARPNSAIVLPKFVSEKERNAIREEWNRLNEGLDNGHRTAILQGGADLKTFSITARDSQLMELREFETREVALFLGIPPHKLGVLNSISYNSQEQSNQDYLDTGLDPWLVTWEEECWDKLLTEEEKRSDEYHPHFDREQLLRADLAARATYYQIATGQKAWMLPSEVREKEGLEPNPDLDTAAQADPDAEPGSGPPGLEGDGEIDQENQREDERDAAPSGRQTRRDDMRAAVREVLAERGPAQILLPPINVDARTTVNVPGAEVRVENLIPAQQPPTVQNVVNVPEQAPPVVQNTVNVPQQPAAEVRVENTVNVPETKGPQEMAIVSMPKRVKTVDRDDSRDIERTTEEDAA